MPGTEKIQKRKNPNMRSDVLLLVARNQKRVVYIYVGQTTKTKTEFNKGKNAQHKTDTNPTPQDVTKHCPDWYDDGK